jgi:hypothetical protein
MKTLSNCLQFDSFALQGRYFQINIRANVGSESRRSDQSAVPTANVAVCTAESLYSAPDGEICCEHFNYQLLKRDLIHL